LVALKFTGEGPILTVANQLPVTADRRAAANPLSAEDRTAGLAEPRFGRVFTQREPAGHAPAAAANVGGEVRGG
jgi:hypothetical protein